MFILFFYLLSGLFLLALVVVVPFTLSIYLLVWLPSKIEDVKEFAGPDTGPATIREAIPYSEAMKMMKLDELLANITENESLKSQLKENASKVTNGKNLGIDF